MCARLYCLAKEASARADSGEMITHQIIAGVRTWLVIGPAGAAQILKRSVTATTAHNHIRVIDRSSLIARCCHHGRNQWLDRRSGRISIPGIRQPTDKAEIGAAIAQHLLARAPIDLFDKMSAQSGAMSKIGGHCSKDWAGVL